MNSDPTAGVPAVVRSVRLNAATFGTFVNHLSWFQLEAFYVFLSSVPFWHCPLRNKILMTFSWNVQHLLVTKKTSCPYRVGAHGPEV